MEVSANLMTLCSHRWNVPVIAHLHETPGDSFVSLVRALQISRDALSRTLDALIDVSWLARKGGDHPEYTLAGHGRVVAPACRKIIVVARDQQMDEIAFRRWTLPIAGSLENWSLHFGELKSTLPEITPRALTLALKEMQAEGLLEREIEATFPPSAVYRLTPKGAAFLPALKMVR